MRTTAGIPGGRTPTLTVMADASYHTQSDGQVFDSVELRERLYVDHDNVCESEARSTSHKVRTNGRGQITCDVVYYKRFCGS